MIKGLLLPLHRCKPHKITFYGGGISEGQLNQRWCLLCNTFVKCIKLTLLGHLVAIQTKCILEKALPSRCILAFFPPLTSLPITVKEVSTHQVDIGAPRLGLCTNPSQLIRL